MIKITAKNLKSFSEKRRGLLSFKEPAIVFFTTRFGIHTFFMKYNIDVIILDQNNRVAAFKQNLYPNRIYMWNPAFKNVLELPAGFIQENKIKINSQIELTLI